VRPGLIPGRHASPWSECVSLIEQTCWQLAAAEDSASNCVQNAVSHNVIIPRNPQSGQPTGQKEESEERDRFIFCTFDRQLQAVLCLS